MTRPNALLTALAALAIPVGQARAQDLEPRAFAPTPVGVNFVGVGCGYSTGDVVADASIPLQNGDLQVQSFTLAYVRSLGLWGESAKFQVAVPCGRASGSATLGGVFYERDISGCGDPSLRLSVNFHGAPALSMRAFAAYR